MQVEYFAFISYSHSDERWATWLHRALERYRVPGRLVGQESRDGRVPARIFPVFRDREELPSSADLGANISQALLASRYLVVICSPRSAVSRWVNEEVASFKALGRENRVLCLIVEGEPNASDKPDAGQLECFPPALRVRVRTDHSLSDERVEPIAADVRPGKDTRDEALLKILAGLLGVRYDELRQRELRRRMLRRAQVAVASFVAAVLLVGVWAWRDRAARAELFAEVGRRELLADRRERAAVFLSAAYALDSDDPAIRFMLARAMEAVDPAVAVVSARNLFENRWSPDGRYLVLAGRPVTVWDLRTERQVLSIEVPEIRDFFPGAYFDENTSHLWVHETPNLASVWDLEKRTRIESVHSLWRSPAYRPIVARARDRSIELTDNELRDSKSGVTLARFEGRVNVSPDHRYALTEGGEREGIRLWRVVYAPLRVPIPANGKGPYGFFSGGGVGDAVLSPDNGRVATALLDGNVRLWRTTDGNLLGEMRAHSKAAHVVEFSPDGSRVASAGLDGKVVLWAPGLPTAITVEADQGTRDSGVATSIGLAFDPSSRWLVTSGMDGSVKVWNIVDGKLERSFKAHSGPAGPLQFSAEGRRILTGGNDGFARLWDAESGLLVREFNHGDAVVAVRYAARETRVVTADARSGVRIWEAETGSLIAQTKGDRFEDRLSRVGRAVVAVGDTRILINAASAKDTKLLDAVDGRAIASLEMAERPFSIDISPDQTLFATGSGKGNSLQIWDARNGRLLAEYTGHRDAVLAVRFGSDGETLVTADSYGFAYVWSMTRESRAPAVISRKVKCSVPWAISDGRLVSVTLEARSCVEPKS